MFESRPDFYELNLRESRALLFKRALLSNPETGRQELGVGLLSGSRVRFVITIPEANRLALELVNVLEIQNPLFAQTKGNE
ncbi:hypothetical protein ACX80I_12630 [Arthrobacter sp. MDT3-44]